MEAIICISFMMLLSSVACFCFIQGVFRNMKKEKKILRASWRERLYFLFHGRIPNYAMRANNDISLAWLNILNDPKSEIKYFQNMPDNEKKVIRHFLCTNRISNRKEQVEAFESHFERKYAGDWNYHGGLDQCPPDYL